MSDEVTIPLPTPTPAVPTPFNATRITEKLIVGGGLVGPQEVAWLASQGVCALISAAAELDDSALAHGSGLPALHIPWVDNGIAKPVEDFQHAYDWAIRQEAAFLAAGSTFGLYVHCAAGCNRGPLLATYILARWSGLSADTAWEIVHGMRPVTTAFTISTYRRCCLDALSRHAFIPAGPLPADIATSGASADDAPATAEIANTTEPSDADADNSGRGQRGSRSK